jgi:hypothetical protein
MGPRSWIVRRILPVRASDTITVPSLVPEAIVVPSELNESVVIEPDEFGKRYSSRPVWAFHKTVSLPLPTATMVLAGLKVIAVMGALLLRVWS